jgi:protein TonB
VRLSGPTPSYPSAARVARLEGLVVVEFTVNGDGRVADIELKESGGAVLDQAVIESIRQWRYEPGRKDGIKVSVRLQSRHRFQRN